MTVSELYSQVAQLGFESSLEDDDRFYFAANRALLQVNKIRPAICHYLIHHKPLKNLVRTSTFVPLEKDDDLTFEATDVKSYYFEADGNGVAYIEKCSNGEWEIIKEIPLESTRAFVSYKGFIKDADVFVSGMVRLRFTGEFLYYVKNVALYSQLYSAEEADIPAFEAFTRYNMSELVSDYITLHCPPIKEDGENTILNQDYEIEGNGVILLPYEKSGVYKILYERKIKQLENTNDVQNDDTEIDLDEELCSLLPNLIANYVWCDDEPTKAEYYMNLYRERAAEIVQTAKDVTPVRVKSSNGW